MRMRQDEISSLSPDQLMESLYPDVLTGASPYRNDAAEEARVEAARSGDYYGEPQVRHHADLETLSSVVRAAKKLDRVETMLRYMILRLPRASSPKAQPKKEAD